MDTHNNSVAVQVSLPTGIGDQNIALYIGRPTTNSVMEVSAGGIGASIDRGIWMAIFLTNGRPGNVSVAPVPSGPSPSPAIGCVKGREVSWIIIHCPTEFEPTITVGPSVHTLLIGASPIRD